MTQDAGADRTRGIQMMILGAVVAVLAPLVLLGLVRWSRATRHEPVSRPRTPPAS